MQPSAIPERTPASLPAPLTMSVLGSDALLCQTLEAAIAASGVGITHSPGAAPDLILVVVDDGDVDLDEVREASGGSIVVALDDGGAVEGADVVVSRGTNLGDLLARLASFSPLQDPTSVSILSTRQLEVLTHIASGLSPKQSANVMGISLNTCRDHIKAARGALGVSSVTHAVTEAIRQRLISPPVRHTS